MSRKTMAGVGARIRTVRFRLDRSEQCFAGLLGVEPEDVRAWERGEGINRDALMLIAAATDTAMEWLIAGLSPAEVEAIRAAATARAPLAPAPEAAPGDEGADTQTGADSASGRRDAARPGTAGQSISPARRPSGRRPRGPCQ